jgi:hypothetical protein
VAVKDAQLAIKEELLASQAEEVKLLKRELQLRVAPLNASSPKRRRVHDDCSSNSIVLPTLEKDELLDEVFSFVGGGDHLYAAGVSRLWRGRFLQYCAHATTAPLDSKCVTRHRSSIMSESRLQHAKRSGLRIIDLDMTQPKHAELICKYSLEPERVLTVLRLHGVPWDHVLCRKAAYFCKLSNVMTVLKPWDHCAAASSSQLAAALSIFAATRCGHGFVTVWSHCSICTLPPLLAFISTLFSEQLAQRGLLVLLAHSLTQVMVSVGSAGLCQQCSGL